MIKERDINKFLNGRQFFALTAVLLMVLSWMAMDVEKMPISESAGGVCSMPFTLQNMPATLSWLLNVACMVGVSLLLSVLNKTYSFIRSVTYIPASTYMLLGLVCPSVSTQLYDGTLLSLVTILLAGLLFGIYQSRYPQRRVFLISLILSVCCMYRYAFIFLIPVLFVGFLQMRVISLRSALAMLFGLITPFWIALGTGIVDFSELQLPRWENIQFTQYGVVVITVAITAFITVVLLLRNVLQIINYKMQIRAYNGFFLVLTVFTMIVMAVDYGNILVYLPVLNLCLAVQMGHAFTIKKYLRRYILYLLFVALCIGVYVWRVFY